MNAGVVYGYFAFYQRVEDEEFGGVWELLKEGFVTSFALFLVSHFALKEITSIDFLFACPEGLNSMCSLTLLLSIFLTIATA